MHPFVISTRLDNPRFRVIFDDGDSICYCNSVRSLASILEDHGRIVGVRRLRAVVGPDDRRAPRPTRREFSFEGARYALSIPEVRQYLFRVLSSVE
jgi:hypothetical protein